MGDDRMPKSEDAAARKTWAERLGQAKLTPLTALAFFAALALMSAAATGVSYVVHHLARH